MHFVPDSQQQWVTFVTEAAIGLPRSDRESITELISGLPFELTMMQLSRILGELQPIRLDAHAQLALAHAVFHQHDLMERIGAFIEGGQRRIMFGEQNLTALQRLSTRRPSSALRGGPFGVEHGSHGGRVTRSVCRP
jgi:hypothetical protein